MYRQECCDSFHLAWTIVASDLQFMHVGCDAAECHHHILGYLKIDLPAFVCVCAFTAHSHTGPVVVYCPFFYFLFFFITLSFRPCLFFSCSAAVQEMELIHGYMCSHSLSLFPMLPLSHTHNMQARTDVRTHPR